MKPTALKPRENDATAPAANAPARGRASSAGAKSGSSLSSLLQSRSEYASAKRASAASTPPSPLPDIDSKDKHNPLAAAEYAQDIYCYYRRVEPRFAVSAEYMGSQVGAQQKGGLAATRQGSVRAASQPAQLWEHPPLVARPALLCPHPTPPLQTPVKHHTPRCPPPNTRLRSTRRCAASSSTGSWRCTSSSRWVDAYRVRRARPHTLAAPIGDSSSASPQHETLGHSLAPTADA